MDEESTKGKALADMACSLLTPCYHLGDDDSDGYYEGGDLEDGFVENCDEDSEKEEGESFLPRSAVAKRCSFRLIFKKNAPVLCKLGSVLTAEQDLQDVTENDKNSTCVTFSF